MGIKGLVRSIEADSRRAARARQRAQAKVARSAERVLKAAQRLEEQAQRDPIKAFGLHSARVRARRG